MKTIEERTLAHPAEHYATTFAGLDAYQIPWSEVTRILGYSHRGLSEDDELLFLALITAGGCPASELFGGWIDECGWGVMKKAPVKVAQRDSDKLAYEHDLSVPILVGYAANSGCACEWSRGRKCIPCRAREYIEAFEG